MPHSEDCIPFNPSNLEVKNISGRWKIVEGSHMVMDFDQSEWEANTALSIIRNFDMDSICFVGRPHPSMTYFLSSGDAPEGAMAGEDAISLDLDELEVNKVQGSWKIVEGNHWVKDFGDKESEARKSLDIIKKYNFNKMCFVGRPDPSMTYFLRGESAPGFATKWVIPELKIKLDWDASLTGSKLERATDLCEAFNVRLFDATDGQCRVSKFSIYDAGQSLDATDKGVGHIYESDESQHGHRNGRPDNPEHFHVRLPSSDSEMRQQAGTMFMEWCHSYTGCLDEYETSDNESAQCPESASVRSSSEACIMYDTGSYRKLCRPGIHNAETEQGETRGMSCYEWIKKVMEDADKGYWQIPDSRIDGTEDPISPQFEYNVFNFVFDFHNLEFNL